MERVLIYGENGKILEKGLKDIGFEVVTDMPDMVISFGGDGTFLEAELKYPGVPKLFIKHPSGCKNCKKHDFSKMFKMLKDGKYKMVTLFKVEALVNGSQKKKLVGLNEINVHYSPPRALRLAVKVNRKKLAEHVIGDGVVVATPYGRTAYFSSISKKKFKEGMGIAFNNPTHQHDSFIADKNSVVTVKILRGNGVVAADCNPRVIPVKDGDEIVVKKSVSPANLIELKGFKKKIVKY